MADPRGNLALIYLAIAEQYRPKWLVWENVPGVLSSNEGRDFGSIIGGMVKLGYFPAWRVLDAQYFGVPQRRRRVFIVASSRHWTDSAKVLLEPESLLRNPAPRREKGKEVTGTIGARTCRSIGTDDAANGHMIPDVANPLTARMHKGINTTCDEGQTPIVMASGQANAEVCDNLSPALNCNRDGSPVVTHALRGEGFDASEDGTGRSTPLVTAFAQNQRDEVRLMDKAGALAAEPGAKQQTYLHQNMAVRRLTPMECERLQGFPDNYTNIPGASDSGRYKALGNSMAVPVMHWIGKRINDYEMC